MRSILITNDDGIDSPSLKILTKKLTALGRVYIIVPERERSAGGHALTLHKPLRVYAIPWKYRDVKVWTTNGTPADCIMLGVYSLLPERPSFVISGINKGYNLGTDIIYSGTVSGAREASLKDIPAVSISVSAEAEKEDFEKAGEFLLRYIPKFSGLIPQGIFLNINIPPKADIDDICITFQGKFHYKNCLEKRIDPRGVVYYWLHGEKEYNDEEGSDIWAVGSNKISITPLHSIMTYYPLIDVLKNSL
ncbi:MAG TPA: 5'/3'-nucleotidase SurE [Dictyoglomaceae bacterium]|nr:5'/3'-nucleotidase SurE [Dictyoglomaceae bacterium]HOL38711.1 5'/3'-nucleotidase SurE [Dictyoglomaceae bacterium]HOP94585.1 5'/3'-nucleotidase SurE [Dictyoglomaceae bacterium]HPP15540.1 5'/3'-nucleotidase SurE [Dictyoglomaceae bacterium]HPU42855.1 5'/3'-nucleotidase SurE [Dictyoglomaceae bacterium]